MQDVGSSCLVDLTSVGLRCDADCFFESTHGNALVLGAVYRTRVPPTAADYDQHETLLHLRSSASICGSGLSFPPPSQLPFPGAMETTALRIGGLGGFLEGLEAGHGASGAFGLVSRVHLAAHLRVFASLPHDLLDDQVLNDGLFDQVGEQVGWDPRIEAVDLAGPQACSTVRRCSA